MRIYKGDIYYADLSPVIGCEQGGIRPVLILQNDIGNFYSPTTIVAAITSRPERNPLPTHVHLCGKANLRPSTFDSYKGYIRNHIVPDIGYVQLNPKL